VAIIDLRQIHEDRGFDEAGVVAALNMTYIVLPIGDAAAISDENASRLDKILSGFDGPVLLHCTSSNRVGALLALRQRLHGATSAEALQTGTAAGLTSLRQTVEAKLSER
jgi:protein tyrosine phosphatase (PTP) superfamily phosphohydrolase (DUF442 family)